ncbi:heavy metal translocating P-type ATPase [Ureaplasma zalophigenitalium]|uniref:Cation-translocating P-type ATPase n=1 Tax=Ureaplasma zalophigenitalium TaxID=907723 RepID=A0ABT3BNL3_9BACT|nr:cation-translocating P-type ATPase [Ureaplasma zalophigenitalium]MCV3753839.1 cation-translocating P-type ATPase [Ureaplasma zalophigenitalium]
MLKIIKNKIKSWTPAKKSYVKELTIALTALIISLPLMIFEILFMFSSHEVMGLKGFFVYNWIIFCLSSFVIFVLGWRFYRDAFYEVFKWKKIGSNLLVFVSTFVAYVYSLYALINNQIHYAIKTMGFFETACMIVATMLVGSLVNARIKLKANQDLSKLNELDIKMYNAYDEINKTHNKKVVFAGQIGELVFVPKGGIVPFDGQLLSDFADVDESSLTGEAHPILKVKGNELIAGSANLGEGFIFKITKKYLDSTIHKILSKISDIEKTKPKVQKIADKLAIWFTPLIIAMAILSFILQICFPSMQTWDVYFLKSHESAINNPLEQYLITFDGLIVDYDKALHVAVSVLVISCPCAFGIAIPLAVLIGSAKAARNGIIFNNAQIFEKIKKVTAVAFDKTGTLTTGVLKVQEVYGDTSFLPLIYQLENVSLHPLAKSFVAYCLQNNIDINHTNMQIKELAGVGIIANDNKNQYILTNQKYLLDHEYDFSEFKTPNSPSVDKHELVSSVYLAVNKVVKTMITFNDEIREDAYEAIQILKSQKIKTYVISGDNKPTVERLAKQLEIDDYYAEVKPEEKAVIIERIQKQKEVVMFVGDGINDLLALKQADLAIATGAENQAANAVSDVNLINQDIINIAKLIKLTKQTRLFILLNLLWAFGYNMLFIPLAVLGIIPPFISILIMTTSDIAVVANSIAFKSLPLKMTKHKQIKKKGFN